MTPKDHPIIPEYGNESFKTVPPKKPKPLKPIHPAPIILFLGILFNYIPPSVTVYAIIEIFVIIL